MVSQLQEMKPLKEKITLNIGGLRYETYASTLQALPGTKLCRLTDPQAATAFDYDPDTKEFFFDRSSCLFEEVLDYCRTKQLHCPDLTCKSVLDEELAFWGLSNTPLSPCCWQKLTIAEGRKEEYGIQEEEHDVAGLLDQAERSQSSWRGRWPTRIWTVFEKPFSSSSAKVNEGGRGDSICSLPEGCRLVFWFSRPPRATGALAGTEAGLKAPRGRVGLPELCGALRPPAV